MKKVQPTKYQSKYRKYKKKHQEPNKNQLR